MRTTAVRAWVAAAAVAVAVVAGSGGVSQAAAPREGVIRGDDSPAAVPGRYIVALKDAPAGIASASVRGRADGLAGRFGGTVNHVYDQVLRGFSVSMSAAQARRLAADPAVDHVEQVQEMGAADVQDDPPNWGIDRIDQPALPLDGSYSYPDNAGEGVTVYVIDSGINAGHSEFAGRVRPGVDFVDDDDDPADCQGHGTHVAGIAVGATAGVAKKANVVSVRVLDCQGSGQDDAILAGLDWVKANAVKPAVVNYSIGCRKRCSLSSFDKAAKAVIDSGLQFVMAAGNNDDDACYFSPQKVAAGITVGNSTKADKRYSSTPGPSNYGSCLDLWAPGTAINSADNANTTGFRLDTGTSMAAPHVTGVSALYLAGHTDATPKQVRDAIVGNGVTGKLGGIKTGSPNVLLQTGFLSSGVAAGR
ncbi:S8 family peptidase [Longispora sp. NPDC051575]|uniref:S8 family peptidase n=1 Tax=Longispora sp. NPDC051575 TaxID=3154943 RepID=UPI003418D4F7